MAGATRSPGVVPNDLRQRIDRVTGDLSTRMLARLLAGQLDGLAPSSLAEDERVDLREAWGSVDFFDRALEVLERVGYGAPRPRRSRAQRAHGLRREPRLRGVLGKLPRALALRLPTSACTHHSGPNDGVDRWGAVTCSRTLRAAHLGVIAAAGGLWSKRAEEGEGHVDVTAGELVQLLTGRRRVGGKDVAWVHGLLADLEDLQLQGDVRDRSEQPGAPRGGPGSEAHRIPCSPIERVERRVGDRWVAAGEYADAVAAAGEGDGSDLLELRAAERADCAGVATIRVHLAQWVRDELAHPKRRAVFINFDVWAHLRPQSQRTYAFVQGHGRDSFDERVYFYLGSPTLYTLGLSSQRLDRAAASVRHDLAAIWHGDQRYRRGSGFRHHTHANTRIPAFACDAARIPSAPTDEALRTKSEPKRPSDLRGAVARLRQHSILAARRVTPDQLDPDHVRRLGLDAAKREAELVRQSIERSLREAPAGGAGSSPFHRRSARASDADDPPPG